MNHRTYRALVVSGLMLSAMFLVLTYVDYYKWNSAYMFPIIGCWIFLIFLIVLMMFFGRPETVVRVARFEDQRSERVERTERSRPLPEPAFQPVAPAPKAAVVHKSGGIPFVFNGYTLYGRDVELKNGGTRPIWFFSKRTPKSGKMVAKPIGYHVGVNERTGLPFLKKGAGGDGEDLTPEIEAAYRPQCSALTDEGHQCRNSARADSKYCASHFGYQPPTIAKAAAKREDTLPRVKQAPDTVPSVRKRSTA